MCLEHVLNVDNVGAERMYSGRLFHATRPATQNAQLLKTGMHILFRQYQFCAENCYESDLYKKAMIVLH